MSNSNLEKLMAGMNAYQIKQQGKMISLEQEIAGEDDDKREKQLDDLNDTAKNIEKLVSTSGAGKGKEDQLKKIKDSTSPLSITRVDGERAGKILSAATDNLSKDLETFSNEEQKLLTELVKEIGKLTEKNLEGFNKGIKEVVELAKKGQKLAEQSGNTEAARRFTDTEKAAKEEFFKANKMGLRGDKDTFVNRLGRGLGLKDESGNPIAFNTKKTNMLGTVKAFGTAVRMGSKEASANFRKGFLRGKEGGWLDKVATSDQEKRIAEREKQGWAPEAEKLADLTDLQKKILAERGIAPASEKDISYRKDGKPVSLDVINSELEKNYSETNNKTPIIPASQGKKEAGIAAPVPDTTSDMQEVAAGLGDSPVVDAIEAQTGVIKDISETAKQTLELIDTINKSVQKISDSIDLTAGGSDAGVGPGGGMPDIDIDIPGRRRRAGGNLDGPGGGRKSRSDRARSQPRDARGRFVKKTPDVQPGRKPGRGRGILGVIATGAGAVGLGALAANDDEPTPANVASNAAMSIPDLPEKGTTKAAEKGAAKAGEKTAIKAGEKVAAKGVAKTGAKAVGKSLLKKIPGVSILAGGAFAAQRAMQGDWIGAGGELLSGIAGTVPGVGTAASVGIDAALAARDMGALGGTPETRAAAAQSQSPKPATVQGKPGGGIFSRAAGFVKKNPLMAAAGLGGVGLAAVGASKAWDWMTSGDENKVESGKNPDSGILEQGTEQARDKMQVNVPPPTVINQGGGGNATAEKTTVPNTKSYVRDDESSWMRFALKRAMA